MYENSNVAAGAYQTSLGNFFDGGSGLVDAREKS